jgi:hypothetical protein
VTLAGVSDAVAPLGAPLTLSETVPAEPDVTAVLIVELPAAFCASDRLVGLALMEKSLPTTVSGAVAECVADAPVPVTVIV